MRAIRSAALYLGSVLLFAGSAVAKGDAGVQILDAGIRGAIGGAFLGGLLALFAWKKRSNNRRPDDRRENLHTANRAATDVRAEPLDDAAAHQAAHSFEPPSCAPQVAQSTTDDVTHLYSRQHKEKLHHEAELSCLGDTYVSLFRDRVAGGGPLMKAVWATQDDFCREYALRMGAPFERAARALTALRSANAEAHREILKAHSALGSDFDWNAARQRLKDHHRVTLDYEIWKDLAWLLDPATSAFRHL